MASISNYYHQFKGGEMKVKIFLIGITFLFVFSQNVFSKERLYFHKYGFSLSKLSSEWSEQSLQQKNEILNFQNKNTGTLIRGYIYQNKKTVKKIKNANARILDFFEKTNDEVYDFLNRNGLRVKRKSMAVSVGETENGESIIHSYSYKFSNMETVVFETCQVITNPKLSFILLLVYTQNGSNVKKEIETNTAKRSIDGYLLELPKEEIVIMREEVQFNRFTVSFETPRDG